LKQAIDKGYKDIAQLQQDPNLEPLRPREEFQKLVAELEATQKKGQP
jgi:hypothetical protein